MYRFLSIIPLFLVYGMTSTAPARADEPSDAPVTVKGATHVATIEGISEYKLPNGLRVLLFPDQSKPTVTVNMTVFVGSRHEGYGETGMAHLLEHMLFKGTPTHTDIPQALQERGARFNGTTWVDRTNYFETLPASPENLEFAIQLEADRLVNSTVLAKDLESEMTVVRNEFERGENNPAYILAQQMTSAAYEWHNYGQSTIGNRADIERVPIENLQAFYHKYYQPDNVMVIVAGNFEPEHALKTIVDSFGQIPEPERKLPETYTVEPPQQGARLVTLRRVGKVPLAGAVYHIPAGSHPSFPAIDVLVSILSDAPSGRLYEALVKTQRAASVSGAAFAWHDPGIVRFLAEVNTGNDPQAVLRTLLEIVEGISEKPVTKEEVNRAKQKLLKQRELAAANSTQIAIQLSEWAAMGDWRLYFLYRDRLEDVTVEKVNTAGEKYFQSGNRTAGLFLPTSEPQGVHVPLPPDNLSESIGEYEGRGEIAQGEAFDVSPENIKKRTTLGALPSGLDTAVLTKQNRGNTVVARLNLRYGNLKSLEGMATAADLLPILMTRGTTEKSRQEIRDRLDELGARLAASGEPGVATFVVKAKHEQLPAVFKLLGEILRNATLPADQLEILKQARIATYESQLNDPQALATTAVRRAIAPYKKGDPRYVPTIEEEIHALESVTTEKIQHLYKTFLNGAQGELVVVGDFDPEPIIDIAKKALGDWTSKISYAHLPAKVPTDLAGQTKAIATPGKENATYFAATVFPMTSSDPDYPALVIGNYILGASSLSSRLADRVRQKEGLSYGVGSGFSARDLDPRAVLYLYASTKPVNIDKVKKIMMAELKKLLDEGITEKELAAAKQGYLQRLHVGRASDAQLAQILADNLQADRTMAFQAKLEQQIQSLTTEDVESALREHINPKQFVVVTAGDFSP